MGLGISDRELDAILGEPPKTPAEKIPLSRRSLSLIRKARPDEQLLEREAELRQRESSLKEKEAMLLEKETEIERAARLQGKQEAAEQKKIEALRASTARMLEQKDQAIKEAEDLENRRIEKLKSEIAKLQDQKNQAIGEAEQQKQKRLEQLQQAIVRIQEQKRLIEGELAGKRDLVRKALHREKEQAGLENQQEFLQAKAKQIVEMKQSLDTKESTLYRQEKLLKSREGKLGSIEAAEKRTVEALRREIASLEQRKGEFFGVKRDISRDKASLAEKEEEILDTVKRLEKDRRLLTEKEKEIIGKVNELEENRQILMKEEQKAKAKLTELLQRGRTLESHAKIVMQSKIAIEEMIPQAQSKIESLAEEWEAAKRSIKEDLAYLSKIRKGLPSFLQQFREEQKREKARIQTLESASKSISIERKGLEDQENSIAKKLAELRQIRNEQRDKERELSSREEKIRRAQELKENIGKLVLEHKRAQMSVEEETEKLKKITAESMAKMGLIKDREIELMKRAARLQRKEDFLVQKEADLRQQKIHTLHEEFQAI